MKIICIGRNYADHIDELANERPESPVIFMKPETALVGDGQLICLPHFSQDVQHEVELVVKVSKCGKNISCQDAHRYYDEIALGLDLTARDVQQSCKAKGLPWEKAKSFDGSAVVSQFYPVGDYDANRINFSLEKNGQLQQCSNSALMLWSIDELIAEISRYFTLSVGDLIFTGTPAGVSSLHSGDELHGVLNGVTAFQVHVG